MKLPSFQELTKFLNKPLLPPLGTTTDTMEKLPLLTFESPQQPPPLVLKGPFYCSVCDRPFKRKSDMSRHSRIHLKVKPFNCFYCDKGFTRIDSLSRHCKTKHKIIK